MTAPPPPSPRYYTPGQVALAAFIGSVPAASWLMARTSFAVGDRRKARQAAIFGSLGTLALLVLIFVIPAQVPLSAFPAGITIGFYQMALQSQGRQAADWEARGIARASWWAAVGIGLLGLIVMIVVIAAIAFMFSGGQ